MVVESVYGEEIGFVLRFENTLLVLAGRVFFCFRYEATRWNLAAAGLCIFTHC